MTEESPNFDDATYGLLVERIEGGRLQLVSPEGVVHEPQPQQTVLVSADYSDFALGSKYKSSLRATPFDAVNPRLFVPGGCPGRLGKEVCGNRIVSYQQFGETKKIVCVCMCGHRWEGLRAPK
jgi:hypothetical protein